MRLMAGLPFLLAASVTSLTLGCQSRDSNEDRAGLRSDPDFGSELQLKNENSTFLVLGLGDVLDRVSYQCWYEVPIRVEGKKTIVSLNKPQALAAHFVRESDFQKTFEFLAAERRFRFEFDASKKTIKRADNQAHNDREKSANQGAYIALAGFISLTAIAAFVGVPAPLVYVIPFGGFALDSALKNGIVQSRAPTFLKDEIENRDVLLASALYVNQSDDPKIKLLSQEMMFYVRQTFKTMEVEPERLPYEKWLDQGEPLDSGEGVSKGIESYNCAKHYVNAGFPDEVSFGLKR